MPELRLKRNHISGYIDDFYVQGQTNNECQVGIIEAIKLFDELGYVIHPIKISLNTKSGEHLNSVKMTVTLKIKKIVPVIRYDNRYIDFSFQRYKTNCTVSGETCFKFFSKYMWAIVLQKY